RADFMAHHGQEAGFRPMGGFSRVLRSGERLRRFRKLDRLFLEHLTLPFQLRHLPLDLVDVFDTADQAARPALPVAPEIGARQNPEMAAVATLQPEFGFESPAGTEGLAELFRDAGAVLGMDERVEGLDRGY